MNEKWEMPVFGEHRLSKLIFVSYPEAVTRDYQEQPNTTSLNCSSRTTCYRRQKAQLPHGDILNKKKKY